MFFLNLSLGEFLTLLGAVGGLITALYLLDRSKRKKVVSTLRFWAPARTAEQMQSRRRMREPWSLLLQLLGLILLLLAIAQLQWGSKRWLGHDHVLLLDTSAWSGAGGALEQEKNLASSYLDRLAAADRVMVVRVDGLATPATPFTSDRTVPQAAIAQSKSSVSALKIESALSFAQQAMAWTEALPGETVYVGPAIAATESAVNNAAAPRLRVLAIENISRENVGIRRLAAKRSEHDASSWDAAVTLKNDGTQPHTVRLDASYSASRFNPRTISIAAHAEQTANYTFTTTAAGEFAARLLVPGDSLDSDNEVRLRLPKSGPLRVTVYTARAKALSPLFTANRQIAARFLDPGAVSAADDADVIVFDQTAPSGAVTKPSLWIAPPRNRSPIAIKSLDSNITIKTWHNETALGAGLHARDAHIRDAQILETLDGDIPVANADEGAVVVAREANPRLAVVGFDPLQPALKFEVTTPLLFANLIGWLSPEAFRSIEVSAQPVGIASVALDPKESAAALRVTDDAGNPVVFTVRDGLLQTFAAEPSILHVTSAQRERVVSLTLPDVAEREWKPAAAFTGLPGSRALTGGPVDLWKWLAAAGLLCLLAEWLLYGQQRRTRFMPRETAKPAEQSAPELVAK